MPRKSVVYLIGTNTRQRLCHVKDLLTEDVSDHLNGCYKTIDTYTDVEEEWELRMYRVGLFDKA